MTSLLEKMRGDRQGWYKVSDLTVGTEIAVPSKTGNILWDEIVSITPVGREQVYDIEVEGTHNFVGNDIFAHNTAFVVDSTTHNVGIGTTTPYALLSLVNNTTSLVDIFAIATSTSGLVFKVDSYGRTYGDGAYSTPAADYAEYFKTKSAGLQSGEVVCVDMVENSSVKRCERGADNNVMGIVSTKPSVIGNYTKAAEADPAHYAIIGMMGQVDTFVSAENGAINVGDSLTSASSTSGYAMRADGGDSTVGIALEPLPSGTGKIKVLISRRNKSLAVEEVETLVVERIANMKIEDSVQQMVKQAVDKVMETNLAVSGNIFAGSYETVLMPATSFTLGSTVSTTSTTSTTSTSSVQAMFTAEIPSAVLTADGKGVDLYKLATYNLSGITALAEKFAEHEVRLTALETKVTALENGTANSTSGTPSFSTTSIASALESLGAFISKGIAQFGTLIADRFVAATDSAGTSSAGTATILAGNTVAQVDNAYVLPSSKIFVTLTASTTGSWYISDKQEGSFRLVLSEVQASDVSFDYFIVQTEGQVATSTPATNNQQSTANDNTPPVITLLGDNPTYVSIGGTFVDSGITVVDDTDSAPTYVTFVDGIQQETSGLDTSSQTTHIITYSATDKKGNSATATRSVIIGSTSSTTGGSGGSQTSTSTPASTDTTPPVVTLTGDVALQIIVGDSFTDPGATATDPSTELGAGDTDLTASIVVTGVVDTATAGLYTLTYTATDTAGNIGSVSRVVNITAPETAATSTPSI